MTNDAYLAIVVLSSLGIVWNCITSKKSIDNIKDEEYREDE